MSGRVECVLTLNEESRQKYCLKRVLADESLGLKLAYTFVFAVKKKCGMSGSFSYVR